MKLSIVTVHLNNYAGFQKTLASIILFSKKGIVFNWIIKDGSSTFEVINKIKADVSTIDSHVNISLLMSEDKGVYDAMNQAMTEIPQNSLVLFLNSGDQLSPSFIDNYRQYENQEFDFIYSDTVLEKERTIWRSPETIDFSYLLAKTINHQSYFINVNLLKKYPFKTKYSIVADWVQLMEIFRNETIRTKKLKYPISVYEGGGISEKNNSIRLVERERYLLNLYSRWEMESLTIFLRMRMRSWYPLLERALDSPKRSWLLSLLSRII